MSARSVPLPSKKTMKWVYYNETCFKLMHTKVLLRYYILRCICCSCAQTFNTLQCLATECKSQRLTVIDWGFVINTRSLWNCFQFSDVTRVGDIRGSNWGCHPLFFSWKTWRPFLSLVLRCHPWFLLLKNWPPFLCSSLSLSLSLFIAFTRVSPPRGCHPTPFLLSDLVSPLFFVNLPTKNIFLRVSPPEGCHPGRSAP